MDGRLIEHAGAFEVLFVGGKGGVGKTTCSAALAVQLAARGQRTLVVSTDPAHSLGDALQTSLTGEPLRIADKLHALELNPERIIAAHFKRVEEIMRSYARPEMMPALRKHLALARIAPGAEEAAMLEAVCRLLVEFRTMGYDRLVFDTAPTGHTLRLLMLPEMMRAWTEGMLSQHQRQHRARTALQAMEEQAQALHTPVGADDTRFAQATQALNARKELFERAREHLMDSGACAVFLVMTPEPLPLLETRRSYQQLRKFGLPLRGIIVNQIIAQAQHDDFWRKRAARQRAILQEAEQAFADAPLHRLALQADDIRGVEALSALEPLDPA